MKICIHPFCLSRIGLRWQQGIPDVPLHSNTFVLLLGDTEARWQIPQVSLRSTLGSPPSWTCAENLQTKVSRMHPTSMPKPLPLAPFDLEGAAGLEGWAQPTYGRNSFWPLVCTNLFCRSLPKAHDHRWGLECSSKALPFGSALSSPQQSSTRPIITADTAPIWLLISYSFLPSLVNIPRYLNSFSWASNSLPTQREKYPVFWQRTFAACRSVANRPLVSAKGHSLMKQIVPCHLQKPDMQFWDSQTRHSPNPGCALRSWPLVSQTGSETRGKPSPHPLETCLTLCRECGHSSGQRFLTFSANTARDMGDVSPKSSDFASSTEDILAGLRISSKCSSHQSTISPVQEPNAWRCIRSGGFSDFGAPDEDRHGALWTPNLTLFNPYNNS